ncbi:MAG: tRNA preQ1(34) S-adenosylmethionine ribosyltransferase-isomerase QueA [Bacilli bacterium]|nr:tRNA preQ1(34) S-adenosylmethionine ribosyltransferase-isomerase QueA [Bacilli bacterium]
MKLDYFDYNLPEELIAQTPLEKRSDSRLMIVNRKSGAVTHEKFFNIVKYLGKNDVLVLNDTKVVPSRIYGTKQETNASIEILLLKELVKDTYECLVRPARRISVGTIINFKEDFSCVVTEKKEEGICVVKFNYKGIFLERLEEIGEMPLPPYIHEKLSDNTRYQTVYAKHVGSAAAPTAGFHFTKELLDTLAKSGVEILYVTLHVGLGTFRPVSVENIEDHHMHSEAYEMSESVAKKLNQAKAMHKRIISVGTTSTRTLESIYSKYGCFKACKEETNIFIYPGYEFKAIDGLITNFHLPKSTLIMLVSAFASRDIIINAYNIAVKEKYRFFSFGDAMFIY